MFLKRPSKPGCSMRRAQSENVARTIAFASIAVKPVTNSIAWLWLCKVSLWSLDEKATSQAPAQDIKDINCDIYICMYIYYVLIYKLYIYIYMWVVPLYEFIFKYLETYTRLSITSLCIHIHSER